MRDRVLVAGVILFLVAVCPVAHADLLRVTTGVSQANLLWETSPPVFGKVTRWGGIGVDVLFGSVTVSAAITVTDFETLTIAEHPAFSFGASIKLWAVRLAYLYARAGLMLDPHDDSAGTSFSIGLGWSPVPFVESFAGVGVETLLPASRYQGTCIYFGLGVQVCWPLL